MAYSLIWLPSVLKAAGLSVTEESGWQVRGHGDVGAIKGVIAHHTAGAKGGDAPDLQIVVQGRPDLAGPLAQLVLARSGTFHVIAAGKAWHAGAGLWRGIHDGNSQMIGIEAENTGLQNDNPWPAAQIDAYAKGVAAILKHIGASPIMCAGHLEWALPVGRKSDPSFSAGNRDERIKAMVAFRARVASEMNQAAPLIADHQPDGTEDAKWLQHALNDLGANPPLKVDGYLGPNTSAAIKKFQIGAKMKPTGTADFATLAAVHGALGHHEGCACAA